MIAALFFPPNTEPRAPNPDSYPCASVANFSPLLSNFRRRLQSLAMKHRDLIIAGIIITPQS